MAKKEKKDLLSYIREGRTMTQGEKLRLIVSLSIPSILAQISATVMFFIDAAMVGHLGEKATALVMLGMLFPKIKWATWTLAIMIGLSRVYVGAHWVSDVIVAAFVGMLCADFAKALLKKINSK